MSSYGLSFGLKYRCVSELWFLYCGYKLYVWEIILDYSSNLLYINLDYIDFNVSMSFEVDVLILI